MASDRGNGFRKLAHRKAAAETVQMKFRHVYGLIGELGNAAEADVRRLEAKVDALRAEFEASQRPGWWARQRSRLRLWWWAA